MKRLACIFMICLSVVYFSGCLGGKTEPAQMEAAKPAEADAPPKLAELQLSASKEVYGADELIPVELQVQTGKFDLLVPYATMQGVGAFRKLVIKNEAGEVVVAKRPLALASRTKLLVKDGKEVRCIQGVELKAGSVNTAQLEDLRTYYNLPAGSYTLQSVMAFDVYKESLPDQSPQVLELQREIALVQANTKLPPDAKQEAVSRLQEELEFIQADNEENPTDIYLPVDSLRGSAEVASNVIEVTVQ